MTTLEQIECRIQQAEDSIKESKQSIHELEITIKELDSRINQSTDATEKTELRLKKKQLNDRLNMLINENTELLLKKKQLNERLNLLINAKFSKPAVSNAGELTSFISLMALHRKLTRSSCYRRGLESIPARHGIWHETKNRIR